MSSSADWPAGLIDRIGPHEVVAPLAARAWRVRSRQGELVVKTGPGVEDEAAGLAELRRSGTRLRVPGVVYAGEGAVAVEWVETGPASPAAEDDLGAGLAEMHEAGSTSWGGGSAWIGDCRVDPSPQPEAASFYGRRLAGLARRCRLRLVADLEERLRDLLPAGGPARLHGDLWWGNVLWSADGRPAVIDPSVHGGHPEEDLAMLALFGSVPDRVIGSYQAVSPLPEGWPGRVRLWQLYPLLVHSVLFGGSYLVRAADAASRYGLLDRRG